MVSLPDLLPTAQNSEKAAAGARSDVVPCLTVPPMTHDPGYFGRAD